jgi:hypothetical protein
VCPLSGFFLGVPAVNQQLLERDTFNEVGDDRRQAIQGVGDFQGHDTVELGVAGFPDGAESAQADPLQELELPQRPHGGLGGRLPGIADVDGAAAAGAEDLLGMVIGELDGIMALRATQPYRRRRGVCDPVM